MRLKKPSIATLREVRITRKGEVALIEYRKKGISSVNLHIGPELTSMTDQDVLKVHNDIIRTQQELAATYQHIAVEVPEGLPAPSVRAEIHADAERGYDVVERICLILTANE